MDRPAAARERELTKSECFELLAGQRLGRLAFTDEQGPIVLPVNFVFDRYAVIVRTDEGTKLDIAGRGDRVAFEVDHVDAATGSAWSVLIRGEATEVTDQLELDRLQTLPVRPWAPGPKSHFMRVLPAVVTGRMIMVSGSAGNRSE
jgi:uncharacterized protein